MSRKASPRRFHLHRPEAGKGDDMWIFGYRAFQTEKERVLATSAGTCLICLRNTVPGEEEHGKILGWKCPCPSLKKKRINKLLHR